jgi:predicted enzyme related to lactoylglutathione lyase
VNPTLGHGKICYVGIPSTDVERSAAFYAAVFGWEIRKRSNGTTAFNDSVGQVSGAFVPGRPPQGESGLLLYVMVDDVAQPIGVDAPEITAHFRDPSGNVLGIYQEPTLAPKA